MQRLADALYSWASILEPETRAQAERLSRLPFIYPHVALMPDAHLGKGATVGSVVPTYRAVIPAAVGVDIGCGVQAVLTQLHVGDLPGDLAPLREAIQANVPASAGGYNEHLTTSARERLDMLEYLADTASFRPRDYAPNWEHQLGSLGSGNHFIEICRDERHRVWTLLHSGSRGIGNKIAQRHIDVAKHFHKVQGTKLEDPDLAWLVEGTPEFARYISEMAWAQRFAWQNRNEMTDRVIWCLEHVTGRRIERLEIVHCHHNYTVQEEHGGRTVWLTRKGAIDAHEGTRGLIPGSMGSSTFVVRGLGHVSALASAPHGAGRVLSRRKARELFTEELLEVMMGGVEFDRSRSKKFLDEIPAAYKPIGQVMHDARHLVTTEHELTQLINVKGD